MYKKYTARFVAVFFLSIYGCCVFAMNITRPYDPFVRAETKPGYRMQVSALGQASFGSAKGYNEDGCKVNILRIWNTDQNALKMLDGFDENSKIGQMRVRVGANDDGVRGHFLVDGNFSAYGFALSSQWALPAHFSVALHLPFYFMRLKNVRWTEQTKNVTADDARTKQYLTNDFFANVCELGDGLDLGGWKRNGIGDISLIGQWLQDFKQSKPFLKNVRVNARAGLNIPSGKRKDEDKIFALPFGTDGGLGLTFGSGLDLTFRSCIRAGFDVELQHVFGNKRCRRIKTDDDQTELLLLAKTDVFKDFGLRQQFSLYAQGYHFWKGLSCMLGYQFVRHGDDILSVFDHQYSEDIANCAQHLQEWTMHNMFFKLSYNFSCEDDCTIHPYIAAWVRIPFNGKSSAQVNGVGFIISIDF